MNTFPNGWTVNNYSVTVYGFSLVNRNILNHSGKVILMSDICLALVNLFLTQMFSLTYEHALHLSRSSPEVRREARCGHCLPCLCCADVPASIFHSQLLENNHRAYAHVKELRHVHRVAGRSVLWDITETSLLCDPGYASFCAELGILTRREEIFFSTVERKHDDVSHLFRKTRFNALLIFLPPASLSPCFFTQNHYSFSSVLPYSSPSFPYCLLHASSSLFPFFLSSLSFCFFLPPFQRLPSRLPSGFLSSSSLPSVLSLFPPSFLPFLIPPLCFLSSSSFHSSFHSFSSLSHCTSSFPSLFTVSS